MSAGMRRFHRFACAFHFFALAFFTYVGTVTGDWFCWLMAGWSIAFGVYSTNRLRKERKGRVAA